MKRISLLLTSMLLVVWAADAQLLGLGARVGIGTGSCGPATAAEYRLSARDEYVLQVVIR